MNRFNFRFFGNWHEFCRLQRDRQRMEIEIMFNWALTFLIVAIVAALFGFSGIAGTATNIAWILFVVGLILALIFFLTGRGGRGI